MFFFAIFCQFLSISFLICPLLCLVLVHLFALILVHMGALHVGQEFVFSKQYWHFILKRYINRKLFISQILLVNISLFLFYFGYLSFVINLCPFYVSIWSIYVPLFWRLWDGFMCAKNKCKKKPMFLGKFRFVAFSFCLFVVFFCQIFVSLD